MEKIVEHTLLYDFYGELLTEHQKKIYEDVVLNDLSLSEAAQEYEISRQGVHDLIKRCNKLLGNYEEKLHLVQRFLSIRQKVSQIQQLTSECSSSQDIEYIREIQQVSNEILEEL